MFQLADPCGAWSPSDGLAAALQAVSGVTPECAEQKPASRFFPRFKRWVFSEEKVLAAAAGEKSSAYGDGSVTESMQFRRRERSSQEQSPAERAEHAAGKPAAAAGAVADSGGLSGASPLTDTSADALRMSVPPKFRDYFRSEGGGAGGGSERHGAAASIADDDAATRLWCTLLCLAWLELQNSHFLFSSELKSLDDPGTMLADAARQAVERAISEEAPGLRPHAEAFYEVAQRQVRADSADTDTSTDTDTDQM